MPDFKVRAFASIEHGGTTYAAGETITLTMDEANKYAHQLESAGDDAAVPADFYRYTPAKIIDYADAQGGGGSGGGGLTAAQTTAAVKSAIETAGTRAAAKTEEKTENGTIPAGAIWASITFDSGDSATAQGKAMVVGAVADFPPMGNGKTYPAIAYTVTNGVLTVQEAR